MINRYPGNCAKCGVNVPANGGNAVKMHGSWAVLCRQHAPAAEAPAPVGPALLARDDADRLHVQMPFDRAALPLLRALPGAKWDGSRKVWTCSAAPRDLLRVLEIADKLKLDVPGEIRDAAAAGTTDSKEAIDRAETAGLYPFQRDGVRWLALQDRALLADDMGLGKTIQTLAALPEGARAVVVAPAAVKYNWRNEARKWRPDFTVEVLSGRGSFRAPRDGEIVITNYDILPDMSDALKPQLVGVFFIVDEAHAAKNNRAKRSKRIKALAAACGTAWFLTGTPLMTRPWDLWGVCCSLGVERRVFGGFNGFLRLFNAEPGKWGGYDFGHVEPEVPERLRRVMLRRMKTEVLPDLPRKTRQTVEINGIGKRLEKQLSKLQKQLENDGWDGASLPPFERFSEIRASLAEARIPGVLEIVAEFEEQETPLLVFSAHRAPVDTLAEREGWAAITGDVPAERRTEIVESFQRGELKGVALTIAAGGVGLTLTRASNELFVDLDWTPALNLQAEDRACRIGQEADAVNVMQLVSTHPLEMHVHKLLRKKMELIEDAVEREVDYEAPEWGTADDAPAGRRYEGELPPAGRYALDTQEGAKNRVAFWRVDRPETGKWAGWTFLWQVTGGGNTRLGAVSPDGAMRNPAVGAVLARIAEDPRGAAARFGHELGVCGVCGRELTNDVSRDEGIGPVCKRKMGW